MSVAMNRRVTTIEPAVELVPETVDGRAAVPNQDPVESNLPRRDLRLSLVARRQALVLLPPRQPMHNPRCKGSQRRKKRWTKRSVAAYHSLKSPLCFERLDHKIVPCLANREITKGAVTNPPANGSPQPQ